MGSDRNGRPSNGGSLLELRNVNLAIDNVHVLKNVNLDIRTGRIHAIVGQHYAGKSSLGKIIAGVLVPDSGKIIHNGKTYNSLSIRKANRLGIEIVHQHLHLFDYFTVAENLMLPDKLSPAYPFIRKNRIIREAEELLESYNIKVEPNKLLLNLEFSEKMLIYILRSILRKPKLLILDEALEKLASQDFDAMLAQLVRMKNEGASVILITHKIDDIYLQLLQYNEAILQKLPLVVLVIDNENRIKMVNRYGQSYFNMENKKFLNVRFMELFDDGNGDSMEQIANAVSSNEEKEFYNVPLRIGNNDIITNIKISPIYDGSFLIGKMIIIEDISRQESLRQQVLLSEKLASIGLLAAGVAHEINNPLEIIYNYLSFLKFNADRAATRETLASIEEEISSIKQIVSNLILFSDSNKAVMEEFDLNELTASIINLIRFKTKHMNIDVGFTTDSASIPFRANKNEVKQVILNLLKNSIEAMPDGGSIRIETSYADSKQGGFVTISVSDTGPGIKDTNPTNVFLPFYSTKNRGSDNLGLGLSISYGIIKKYNGDITVKNRKDSGCMFVITLPVHPDCRS
jgi:signal transduction histidine kinase/ABC-type branched-subunit amino acid transport system ATPase component